jgi:hypothetical protein
MATTSKSGRTHYSFEKKALIHAKYRTCKSSKDRERVVEEHNIGTIQKLYNLASRIDATRPHAGSTDDWAADDGYSPERDYARLYLRDDYEAIEWTEDDDRVMVDHFGKTRIEELGVFLSRSETAVAYRARVLGLRNIPKYYDIKKVAPWLGIRVSDLLQLKRFGLEVFPCCDARGTVQITLVSTTSLARALLFRGLWKRLVDKFDADEIFIRDIIESIVDLQKGEAVWEPNPWVSHGHTSLNPYSSTCFGLFFDGHDSKMVGDDLDPRDLSPSVDVTSDYWRRGANGQDNSNQELVELESVVEEAELLPS